MTDETELQLRSLNQPGAGASGRAAAVVEAGDAPRTAQDLEAVVELDRRVGEPIDIYVNNRLVARGEVIVVEERLGVTMTEIVKGGRA